MSISKFIPTVWSESLREELSKDFIAVNHCNREFEGDIKGKGSAVKICGIGNITIRDYSKNTDINAPEVLSDSESLLNIDKAKYFSFQIDDLDKAQTCPKLMEAALKKASEALANEADSYVFSLTAQAGKKFTNAYNSEESVFETILKAREHLYKNNVGDSTEVFLEVTPKVASQILREKIAIPSTSEKAVEKGYLGEIFGCKIFVSNNVARSINTSNSSQTTYHHCILRTKRAICFADQLSEIEAFRPEKRFSDAVKGLHLYGAKVIYPNEMVTVCIECETEL